MSKVKKIYALEVEELSKRYRIGTSIEKSDNLVKFFLSSLLNPIRNFIKIKKLSNFDEKEVSNDIIWALKKVNFRVKRGEVIGVIGKNGAGKSTLLKILSKITYPTSGKIKINGRVASLLEVGTGFHPELTGKENIYLNGTILGMTKKEIDHKYDDILKFSGVEKFIDTPVKRYSSGMRVRLAFSVAAHLDPEILLIDEVLAVGDAGFQKKCLGKINQVASDGRTVLFVSHNMGAIKNLCSSVILIDNGQIKFNGDVESGIYQYLNNENYKGEISNMEQRVGSGEIRIKSINILDKNNRPIESIISGSRISISLGFRRIEDIKPDGLIVSLQIVNHMDIPIFIHHSRLTGSIFEEIPYEGAFICEIPKIPLPPSSYKINFSIMQNKQYIDKLDQAYEINVINGNFFISSETPPISHGICLVDAKWKMKAFMKKRYN